MLGDDDDNQREAFCLRRPARVSPLPPVVAEARAELGAEVCAGSWCGRLRRGGKARRRCRRARDARPDGDAQHAPQVSAQCERRVLVERRKHGKADRKQGHVAVSKREISDHQRMDNERGDRAESVAGWPDRPFDPDKHISHRAHTHRDEGTLRRFARVCHVLSIDRRATYRLSCTRRAAGTA